MAAHIWFQLNYSFIDPERMKGWVDLVGWPAADGLPTLVVTHQLQVERRTGKVCQSETDVLPLCYATNQYCMYMEICVLAECCVPPSVRLCHSSMPASFCRAWRSWYQLTATGFLVRRRVLCTCGRRWSALSRSWGSLSHVPPYSTSSPAPLVCADSVVTVSF